MDIKGVGPHSAYEKIRIKQEEQNLRQDKNVKDTSPEPQGDEIAVSKEARLRASAYSEAMKSPDVREDKVARLKAMVESGEYKPDVKDIASSIVKEEMEDWDL